MNDDIVGKDRDKSVKCMIHGVYKVRGRRRRSSARFPIRNKVRKSWEKFFRKSVRHLVIDKFVTGEVEM